MKNPNDRVKMKKKCFWFSSDCPSLAILDIFSMLSTSTRIFTVPYFTFRYLDVEICDYYCKT